ncbi:hypothetical protein D3C85_926890 [compost metagenome]
MINSRVKDWPTFNLELAKPKIGPKATGCTWLLSFLRENPKGDVSPVAHSSGKSEGAPDTKKLYGLLFKVVSTILKGCGVSALGTKSG